MFDFLVRPLCFSALSFIPLLSACNSETTQPEGEAKVEVSSPVMMDSGHTLKRGDVLMRSLRPWPRNEEDSRDTLATAEAFGVDRIIWIYENGDDFNGKAHELGFDIGTTMSANARESWIDTLSANEKRAHVDRFTIRNLEGAQVLPEHFKKFGGNPLVTHFVPDQINPEWQEYYINYLVGLYRNGVDSIHRDDPGSLSWAPRSGGSFTDAAVEYFRKYLQKHFTKGLFLN